MTKRKLIGLVQGQRFIIHWKDAQEKKQIKSIDGFGVFTDSNNMRKYRSVLKTWLKQVGIEVAPNIKQLKLITVVGKIWCTCNNDVEKCLSSMQSFPSQRINHFSFFVPQEIIAY